jgi:GntR family transcriptional regulator
MIISNGRGLSVGHAPKYVQVKEEIRRKILTKEWGDGCRVPVEAEFCEMFGVSRITVRKALEDLQAEGYLVKIQGKGTFVRMKTVEQRLSKFYSFSEELRRQGLNEQAEVIELTVVSADRELAGHLQLEPGSLVQRVYRLRRTEHGPYALETSYIPCGIVGELTADMINEQGLYRSMEQHGVVVNSARETFKAVNVNREQSDLLDVRIDAAAIALTRTAYSGSVVVEYCVSIVRGDFFVYSVDLQ